MNSKIPEDRLDIEACEALLEKIENGELYTKQQIEYIAKIVRKPLKLIHMVVDYLLHTIKICLHIS